MPNFMLTVRVLLVTALLAPAVLRADSPPRAHQQALQQAAQAAQAAVVRGPASIPLRDQATLKLPEHFAFVPRKEALALMRAMGNSPGDDLLGLISPLG